MNGHSNSTVTRVDGMVVVTQVFPVAQGPGGKGPDPENRVCAPAKVSEMTATFLRGDPQALGIAQVFVGLLCVISSFIGLLLPSKMIHLALIASVTYVVSGAVSIAASRRTNISLIRATLGLHVLSSVVSLAGMFLLSWILATQVYQDLLCDSVTSPAGRCVSMLWQLQTALLWVWGVVLVLTAFEFCIAVSICVFSGLALGRSSPYDTVAVNAPSLSESTVKLLGPAE